MMAMLGKPKFGTHATSRLLSSSHSCRGYVDLEKYPLTTSEAYSSMLNYGSKVHDLM